MVISDVGHFFGGDRFDRDAVFHRRLMRNIAEAGKSAFSTFLGSPIG